MKIKYTCRSCSKDNFVNISDMLTMGMGRDGVSASEFGIGAMLGSMGSFPGFPGMPGGRRVPREIVHNCIHCKEKNIINT